MFALLGLLVGAVRRPGPGAGLLTGLLGGPGSGAPGPFGGAGGGGRPEDDHREEFERTKSNTAAVSC